MYQRTFLLICIERDMRQGAFDGMGALEPVDQLVQKLIAVQVIGLATLGH